VNVLDSETWSRRRLSIREERSLEKRLGSDDCDKEGLACIMLSMPWDRVETSDAR
jgi:hypothetical protein